MKELLYFSSSDLLIKVEYSEKTNSLKYASHREISFGERVVIEQYILSNVAMKTDYYKRFPALFVYKGEDSALKKDLNLYHIKSSIKNLNGEDRKVKKVVDELIAKSMSNYYFEQIGEEILTLRKQVNEIGEEEIIAEIRGKMDELIKAYNAYSERKVTLEDVIPVDLKRFLQ
jgi:hypothetical protein